MAASESQLIQHLQQVAKRIGRDITEHLPSAVFLVFGSVASGHVDARSDIDLLVINEQEPTLEQRRELTGLMGGQWRFDVGGDDPLFPVIDESDNVQGVAMTLHYQRTAWVGQVLEAVVTEGAITTPLLPFRPFTLAGLLQRAWVLTDERGFVQGWRQRLTVFPPALQRNLLLHFTPILAEQLAELFANAERRLGPRGVLFNLNWATDALVGILYTINDVYDPADRRAEQTIWPYFRIAPRDFSQRLSKILTSPFNEENVLACAKQFQVLALEVLAEVERLTAKG